MNTPVNNKYRHVILSAFLIPGDELIVQSSGDNSYENLPPDGTHVFVVGHHTYLHYIARNDVGRRQPGVYRQFGAVICQFQEDDAEGQSQTVYRRLSPHHLIWADDTLDPQVTRRDTLQWHMHNDGVRVSDLPELPFYEGDLVKVVGERGKGMFDDDLAVVEGIEYHWGIADCADEDKFYRLNSLANNTGTTSLKGGEIELVERGNYYWYEHDQSKLKFADLVDEVQFYVSVGKSVQLKNPVGGDYAWSVEEVERALQNGQGTHISGHWFNRKNSWAQRGRPTDEYGPLWLFDIPSMPELAAKARTASLAAFQQPTNYRYNNDDEPSLA